MLFNEIEPYVQREEAEKILRDIINKMDYKGQDYLMGYVILMKMQYDEVIHYIKLMEKRLEKESSLYKSLLKEIKRLNAHIENIYKVNQGLFISSDNLFYAIDNLMKKMEELK